MQIDSRLPRIVPYRSNSSHSVINVPRLQINCWNVWCLKRQGKKGTVREKKQKEPARKQGTQARGGLHRITWNEDNKTSRFRVQQKRRLPVISLRHCFLLRTYNGREGSWSDGWKESDDKADKLVLVMKTESGAWLNKHRETQISERSTRRRKGERLKGAKRTKEEKRKNEWVAERRRICESCFRPCLILPLIN